MPRGVYKRTARIRRAIAEATRKQWESGDHKQHGKRMQEAWDRNYKDFARRVGAGVSKRLIEAWQDPSYRAKQLKHLQSICRAGGIAVCEKLKNSFYKPSKPQVKLYHRISKIWPYLTFKLDFRMDFYGGFHKLIDIAVLEKEIAIEVDGAYWHSSKKAKQKDKEKEFLLWNSGWELIRIDSKEVDTRTTLNKIKKALRR